MLHTSSQFKPCHYSSPKRPGSRRSCSFSSSLNCCPFKAVLLPSALLRIPHLAKDTELKTSQTYPGRRVRRAPAGAMQRDLSIAWPVHEFCLKPFVWVDGAARTIVTLEHSSNLKSSFASMTRTCGQVCRGLPSEPTQTDMKFTNSETNSLQLHLY